MHNPWFLPVDTDADACCGVQGSLLGTVDLES